MSDYLFDKKRQPSVYFTYLKNAFLPCASHNDYEDRFDNVIDISHLTTSKDAELKILDVGAGTCAFLRKLLDVHTKGNCLTYLKNGAKLVYFAVDHGISEHGDSWKGLVKKCETFSCCFAKPVLLPIDVTGENGKILSDNLKKKGKFDMIHAANILHELPPQILPHLLLTLANCMKKHGKLVLLDPDVKWFFEKEAWEQKQRSEHFLPKSEWEASATWFATNSIINLLEAIGFTNSTALPIQRSVSGIWQVVATNYNTKGIGNDELVKNAQKVLQESFQYQAEVLLDRYTDSHSELKSYLRDESIDLDGDLILKTIKYFAMSASHARYNEVIKGLQI